MLTGYFSEKDEEEINIHNIEPKYFQYLINFLEYYYEIKGKKIQELKEKKRKQKLEEEQAKKENENENENGINQYINKMDVDDNDDDENSKEEDEEEKEYDKKFEAEVENEKMIQLINESSIELKIKKEYSYLQAADCILGLIECADRYLIDDLKEYTKEWLLETINNQSQDIDLLIFIYTRILSLFRYNEEFKEILDECIKNILMNFINIIQNPTVKINNDEQLSDATNIPLLRWNKILLFKSDFIRRSIKLLFKSDYYNIKNE